MQKIFFIKKFKKISDININNEYSKIFSNLIQISETKFHSHSTLTIR